MGLPRWDTMRRSFTPDSQKPRLYLVSLNGAKETRTPDPLHAMQVVFSQNASKQRAYNRYMDLLEQNLEQICSSTTRHLS